MPCAGSATADPALASRRRVASPLPHQVVALHELFLSTAARAVAPAADAQSALCVLQGLHPLTCGRCVAHTQLPHQVHFVTLGKGARRYVQLAADHLALCPDQVCHLIIWQRLYGWEAAAYQAAAELRTGHLCQQGIVDHKVAMTGAAAACLVRLLEDAGNIANRQRAQK